MVKKCNSFSLNYGFANSFMKVYLLLLSEKFHKLIKPTFQSIDILFSAAYGIFMLFYYPGMNYYVTFL